MRIHAASSTVPGSRPNGPSSVALSAEGVADTASVQTPEPPPEMCLYRQRTVALLRRYFRLSIELGRLPSLVGREFFRARVTSYRMSTFEDAVIFAHDVESCLEKLDAQGQALISRMVFQEYTADETANLLHCTRRTIVRQYIDTLDVLSQAFLNAGILREFSRRSIRAQEEVAPTTRMVQNVTISPKVSERISTPKKRVKPFPARVSSQHDGNRANIFFASVSHLPPPICYSESKR